MAGENTTFIPTLIRSHNEVWNPDTLAWEVMTQPVINTDELTVAGSMSVTNFPETWGVTGTFWPETQTISGSVGVSEDNKATIVYESGNILYVCKADIGTALATPLWQIKKINTVSGVVIEWCDGNALYDNVATDLATVANLDYS